VEVRPTSDRNHEKQVIVLDFFRIQGSSDRFPSFSPSNKTDQSVEARLLIKNLPDPSSDESNSNVIKMDMPFRCLHSEDTGSEATFQTALCWLTQCKESHEACGSGPETPLPTRLLDLHPLEGGGPGHSSLDIRLVETAGGLGRYNCLGHCWGQGRTLRTTEETLDLYRDRIQWQLLSKTFQGAIEFTRRLGIRYIWIDSLCIIQSDREDWEKESTRMYSTFQNSYLTIAATRSANAQGACFASPPLYRAHSLKVAQSTSQLGKMYVRKALSHRAFEYSKIEQQFQGELPLLFRGWVYQERLLSSRVLHFTANELFWECTVHICSRFYTLFSYPQNHHAIVIGPAPTTERFRDFQELSCSLKIISSTKG
jgi:hypothetical protein